MSVRMAGTVSLVAVILFLTGVQAQKSVTLSSQSICAARGSTVTISCTYTTYYSREREWYLIRNSDEEERVLSRVSEFSSRGWNDCSLTLWNVRVSDSGVYNFRFKTSSDWITASSGVNLTVTALQVKVDAKTLGQEKVKVTCSSTCNLDKKLKYHWYRNENKYDRSDVSIQLSSTNDQGTYSCRVDGTYQWSPKVCVLGQECWSVTYTPEEVCAPKGSSVDLSCSYKYPEGHTVTKTWWFIKEQTNSEPEDVGDDEEYNGRVQNRQISQNHCILRINDLRESDAQTYKFRFYTDVTGGKYTGKAGVTLTVTDLKVTWHDWGYLSCSSTCILTYQHTYIWYKNGQRVSDQRNRRLYVYDKMMNAGSYSCAMKGYEDIRSPAVCIYNENECWSITYPIQSICALIGSTVDIDSYYTFPDQHLKPQPAWYMRLTSQETELSPTYGRVEFGTHRPNVTTLRLKNLTQSNSAQYLLRFKTPYRKDTQSTERVSLSVTGLQVKVEAIAREQRVKLSCTTTCSLPNNPTYIWYKNGQSLSHFRSADCFVAVFSGAVHYSCAVEGHESFPSPLVYAPINTRAVLVPSTREIVEGDSVTLSCSSDGNPPVLIYTWFKQDDTANTPLTKDQNYSITSIRSQNSGFYYCTARNQLGQHNSTPIHLNVLYPPRNTRAELVSSGEVVEGVSVTLKCSSDANPPDLTYSWFKKSDAADTLLTTGQSCSITNISSQHSGFYYCTAHNRLGQHNSTSIHLDVLYPPRNLTLSHFVTEDSVMLVCMSDANPASSYTWYNKTDRDIKPVGNNTNITVAAGMSGIFYCMAKNPYGSYNSSEWSFSENMSAKYAASAVTVVFLLILILIAVFLWLRRRAAVATSRREENREKDVSTAVYYNVSAMKFDNTRPAASDDEDDVQYSSVHFTRSCVQEVSLYSTVQHPSALSQEAEVEYATVKLVKQRPVRKNEDAIYSTVQKT